MNAYFKLSLSFRTASWRNSVRKDDFETKQNERGKRKKDWERKGGGGGRSSVDDNIDAPYYVEVKQKNRCRFHNVVFD